MAVGASGAGSGSQPAPAPFSHDLRVRYAECDPQGVLFNAHYLAYFDISLTELWRAAFGSYGAMLERGIDLVVAEAQLRYLRPARFDDQLRLQIAIVSLGNSSIISRHDVLRGNEELAQGTMRHVVVDPATLVKAVIPEWARVGLAPWTVPQA